MSDDHQDRAACPRPASECALEVARLHEALRTVEGEQGRHYGRAAARATRYGTAARPAVAPADPLTIRGTNWVDGRAEEAQRGAWFELTSADGRERLGRWPRSTEGDLERALDAARRVEPAWRHFGTGARRDLLARAADALLDAPDPDFTVSRAIGFEEGELDVHLAGLDAAAQEGLSASPMLARGPLGAREGPCVLAPSWASGWHAPTRAVLFALSAGRPVVFAPDGRIAGLGDVFRAAFEDLPPGVFQVLHDDGRTLVRAAGRAALATTVVAGEDRIDADPLCVAHVVVARSRRSTAVIDVLHDIEREVVRILDASIGRARALSGSRSGQIGRLIVHERAFSRVSEVVLEILETWVDASRPLGLAVATQASALESALGLGLDEGATALLAGRADRRSLFPLVFTNVEPTMRIARSHRALGLLLLLRAGDLRSAQVMAARFDREIPA